MKTQGLGLGREVLKNDYNTLYFTTKCHFVEVNANGEETVISYEEAVISFGQGIGEAEFNFWVHNPSGNLYDPPTKEDDEFEMEKKIQLLERFAELARLPAFNQCLVSDGSATRIVSMDVDDYDEVLRMSRQQFGSYGHLGSGFAASLPNYQAKFMGGHLIGGDGRYWNLKFWHSNILELESAGGRATSCPHVWINAEGPRIESEDYCRLIGRCAVKAILSFHIAKESFWGRNPYQTGLEKYPGDPNRVLIVKSFKTISSKCDQAPF